MRHGRTGIGRLQAKHVMLQIYIRRRQSTPVMCIVSGFGLITRPVFDQQNLLLALLLVFVCLGLGRGLVAAVLVL